MIVHAIEAALPVLVLMIAVVGLSYLIPDDEGYYGKRRKR